MTTEAALRIVKYGLLQNKNFLCHGRAWKPDLTQSKRTAEQGKVKPIPLCFFVLRKILKHDIIIYINLFLEHWHGNKNSDLRR